MKTVRIRKCLTEAKLDWHERLRQEQLRGSQWGRGGGVWSQDKQQLNKVNTGFKIKNLNTHICDHIDN